jgi:1,4-dihydroxy-2-naphthoate octaprenyltransferase
MKLKKDLIDYIKKNFKNASLNYIDADGFASSFSVDKFEIYEDKIIFDKPPYIRKFLEHENATLIFNHITEIPTGGYTDRRYISIIGNIKEENNKIVFIPKKFYRWDEKIVPFVQYCEINVPNAIRYLRGLEERIGRKIRPLLHENRVLDKIYFLFRIYRLPFLFASLFPCLISILLANKVGYFDLFLATLLMIGVALIHMGLNLANDYFDYKADEINRTPTPFSGGSRSLQYGLISPNGAKLAFLICYLIAIPIGIYLAIIRGLLEVLTIMTAGVAISLLYTAPPAKLSYRGFGEIAVAIGFGPIIMLGSYFVMTQKIDLNIILASIPIGIIVCSILYINEIPDRKWDAKAGKRTLVTRISKEKVPLGYAILIILTYATQILAVMFKALPISSLLTLLFAYMPISIYKNAKKYIELPYEMVPSLDKHIRFYVIYSAIISASIIYETYLPLI